ncbi:MAG: branched-chain amino acid ABC transporter permease [Oscillospiraceae bacterium]|nr:branched-chain amino acid ABC transporter permease [Oscillospiraceae bacterium]
MKTIENKRGMLITAIIIVAFYLFVAISEPLAPSNWSMLFTVLKKGSIYALIAVSMNLLNGFTGLFSLGQAGFMLLGAYTYGILTIPVADRASVYQYFDGGVVQFALPMIVAVILAGLVAAFFAYLIGLPVLRLKSDYLAIATLGFAEIIRAVFQWNVLGPITNGSNLLRKFPYFTSTLSYLIVVGICVAAILLLINSSYGRAFKAIREDEVAAEAMGINLAKHKMLAFCISSFFAGIGGALLAMYQTSVQASIFKSAMTYEILLIVVIGGIGSISGSVIASFLYIACSEWWLRFLDNETILSTAGRTRFIVVMAVIFVALLAMMIFRIVKPKNKEKKRGRYITGGVVSAGVLVWLAIFAATGATKVPLLRNGFRMVVFSVIIMIIVLFFSQGLMGTKELPDLFRKRAKKAEKEAAK